MQLFIHMPYYFDCTIGILLKLLMMQVNYGNPKHLVILKMKYDIVGTYWHFKNIKIQVDENLKNLSYLCK